MDSNQKDSGRLVGHVDWSLLSPLDLSPSLLIGGSSVSSALYQDLLVLVTRASGYSDAWLGAWFQSVVPSNNTNPPAGWWSLPSFLQFTVYINITSKFYWHAFIIPKDSAQMA